MKPKDHFLEDYLLTKKEDNHKEEGKIFPLGYTDKRDVKKRRKTKSKKSLNSSKSGSSESIEEKDEDLEDDFINIKNNSDPEKKNEKLLKDDFKLFPFDEDSDSDSEIVEEEIITEETIAKIYADKTDDIMLDKNNINIKKDISPISETLIVKKNIINEEDKKNLTEEKNIIVKEKRQIFKYKDNILFKYFNHKSLIAKMRIITLIILILYIILLIANIFSYAFTTSKLTIFCFEFVRIEDQGKEHVNNDKYNHKLFLSDRISFFIIQILCGIPFISIIFSLVKNDYLPLKQFFKETSFYFPLTLVLNMPIIILSIINDEYERADGKIGILLPIIFTILTLIGFLSITFILFAAKNLKYKSISSFINISVLCSFLSAFQCYSFLYNVCLIIRAIYQKEMFIPEIIMGIIYFIFGIVIIISFRDIFFVGIVVIIELGLLYIKKNIAVTIVNLSTTFFSFSAIIINIFKYKKKVCGITRFD